MTLDAEQRRYLAEGMAHRSDYYGSPELAADSEAAAPALALAWWREWWRDRVARKDVARRCR